MINKTSQNVVCGRGKEFSSLNKDFYPTTCYNLMTTLHKPSGILL